MYINKGILIPTVIVIFMTFYVVLNEIVYAYTVTFAVLLQLLYWIYKPYGPKSKSQIRQETTGRLHEEIDNLNGVVKVQRNMIELLLEANTELRKNINAYCPTQPLD